MTVPVKTSSAVATESEAALPCISDIKMFAKTGIVTSLSAVSLELLLPRRSFAYLQKTNKQQQQLNSCATQHNYVHVSNMRVSVSVAAQLNY